MVKFVESLEFCILLLGVVELCGGKSDFSKPLSKYFFILKFQEIRFF
jgi:hypothetical protein